MGSVGAPDTRTGVDQWDVGWWVVIGLVTTLPFPAQASPPLGYMQSSGLKADPVVSLTWGLLIISIVVVVIVSGLVVVGIWLRREKQPVGSLERMTPRTPGSGLPWLYWGVGISSVALFGSLIWTVVVLAAVSRSPAPTVLAIEVTGQQWWWKVRYLSDDPSQVFATADEIHIPAGQPVRVKLVGADVIHSFWVPALGGKTDAIPGMNNETWIEARAPGRYWGECTEYCGQQHAHMAFAVVAELPERFQIWRDAQLRPATAPTSPERVAGEKAFVFHCGACHAVRGTAAGGSVAPDLTHLMSRTIIAGGVLPNTVANLMGWIANPQAIKPGARMPILYLSGPELQSIGSYVETLR